MVPYREGRLTLLFKNYFEGNGQVKMTVCANLSIEDFEENMHMMKFAQINRHVKLRIKSEMKFYTPRKNRVTPRTSLV